MLFACSKVEKKVFHLSPLIDCSARRLETTSTASKFQTRVQAARLLQRAGEAGTEETSSMRAIMAGVANTFRSPLPMSAAVFLPWTHATVASPRMPCRERQRVTAYNALLVRAAAMHRSRVLASAGTRAHVGRASFAPRSSHPARRSPASRPHARRPHVRRSAHRLDVCARGHPGPEAAVLLACALQGPPQH